MITVFNRKKLVTLPEDRQIFPVRAALEEVNIPHALKTEGLFSSVHNRGAGIDGLAGEKYQYHIYVRRQDYDRAAAVVKPILQGFGM